MVDQIEERTVTPLRAGEGPKLHQQRQGVGHNTAHCRSSRAVAVVLELIGQRQYQIAGDRRLARTWVAEQDETTPSGSRNNFQDSLCWAFLVGPAGPFDRF